MFKTKNSFNFIKLSSKVFNNIEKIIKIGAEKMNSKFCFSCYSKYNSNKKYIIYNDINRFLNIYSINNRKNLRILKNLTNPDEDIYENVKSIKVFDDTVNNEKIVIFSTEQKSINKLKIYELRKYSLRNVFIFDNPINDFCFYNLGDNSFIALNEQGKEKINIFKDGLNFRKLNDNDLENVQCMECYEGLNTRIYLLVTGNNYLKSFDMNSYKLYKNYNINNEESYTFSKFYITKDKFLIITSLKNGNLKLIDFDNPNSYEIINNTIPIISFNFLNAFYLFAATEDKKIKIFDLKEKKIIDIYRFDNNIISLEIMPDLKNSFLYIYDKKGNIFEIHLNQI
jgi:WD40 repeat protein